MTTMRLRRLICVLAWCCLVWTGQSASRAEEPDFPELVQLAERYGFRFPPKDGPLVLGWTQARLVNTSTREERGIYLPAFLLQRLPKGSARLLMGWKEETVASSPDSWPTTLHYSLVTQEAYDLHCHNLCSFVTAVQLAQRGAMDDAQKLWDRVKTDQPYIDDDFAEDPDGWKQLLSEPRKLLACCLFEHLYCETLAEKSDWHSIYRRLLALQGEFPFLFADDPKDSRSSPKSQFVRDLGLAVHAPKPE
jgi:hypothetical protein